MSEEFDPESTQRGGMVAAAVISIAAFVVLAAIIGSLILSLKP